MLQLRLQTCTKLIESISPRGDPSPEHTPVIMTTLNSLHLTLMLTVYTSLLSPWLLTLTGCQPLTLTLTVNPSPSPSAVIK